MSTTQSDVQNLVNQEPIGAEPTPALEGDEQLFAELAEHDDYAEPVVETEPTPAPTPATSEVAASGTADGQPSTAASEQPTASIPPPSAPEQPTPTAAPTAPAEAVTSPTEQGAIASPPAPEPTQAPVEPVDFAKHREATLPQLEQYYQLTPEEAEEARLEPEKVLPKFAARLHYEVASAIYNSVMANLPQAVTQTLEVRKAETEAEDAFYSKWPDLKDPKHKAAVINSVKAYKTANPKAQMSEVIERAGLMAMLSLGLAPRQSAPEVVPPPQVVQKPAVPLGAGAGAAPFTPARIAEDNVFAELAEAELRGELY